MILILTPEDKRQIARDYKESREPLGSNLDLIEALTGIPNLTHVWNQFALRAEVVEKVARASAIPPVFV